MGMKNSTTVSPSPISSWRVETQDLGTSTTEWVTNGSTGASTLEGLADLLNEQQETIARLRAEVKAWREAEDRHDLTHLLGDRHNEDVLRAMAATDASGALKDQ